MGNEIIILFLTITIIILFFIVLYQKYKYKIGIKKSLIEMNESLLKILNIHSNEKVMIFTDNKILMELAAQINRLLEEYQKNIIDYKYFENSTKKMFSNISHDIKTPMTVILGYLEMMQLQDNVDKNMVIKVEKKAEEVIDLINQIFTLAKLEAGDINIELSRVNLNEICKESILYFYDILNKNEFEVDVEIPESSIFVLGNQNDLRRIFFNLISNVIRYGSHGKYLGIRIYSNSEFAYVDIVDKGKGIEKEFAESIFERLYTMEDSRNKEIQGSGLGLTISKSLAKQLGGDIFLESEPNIKTKFTLKLNKISY